MGCPSASLEQLDVALASLAREQAVLRLHLGQAREVVGRGAVFDLGFSSLAAYAVERCERSARWAEGARCLARRVERLPELRHALVRMPEPIEWTEPAAPAKTDKIEEPASSAFAH